MLSELPRTRPQRASARRERTRKADTAKRSSDERPSAEQPPTEQQAPRRQTRVSKQKGAKAQKPARKRTRVAPASPPPAPRQGYEPDTELTAGSSISPPSGGEMAGAIVELAGEMAQNGLSAGARFLKGLLGRLPGV